MMKSLMMKSVNLQKKNKRKSSTDIESDLLKIAYLLREFHNICLCIMK